MTQKNWGFLLITIGFLLILFFSLFIPQALVVGSATGVLLLAIGGLMVSGRLSKQN